MKYYECPRYEKCNAPICPLLKSVNEQKMLHHERVCSVLLEYQKDGSEARMTAIGLGDLIPVMSRATEEIKNEGTYRLRSAIEQSAKTASQIDAGLRLAKSRTA
jgi:hypothetical protein